MLPNPSPLRSFDSLFIALGTEKMSMEPSMIPLVLQMICFYHLVSSNLCVIAAEDYVYTASRNGETQLLLGNSVTKDKATGYDNIH